MDTGARLGATDRPVLIVGCARSGTTMLQLMLDRHSSIAIPSETRFLVGLHRRRVSLGDLRDRSSLRSARSFVLRRDSLVSELAVRQRAIRRGIEKAPRTVGSVGGSVFATYAALQGKQRWGDKRPNHIRHVPALLEMFPDAQIVHIIRDGRDCVSSLLSVPWWEHGLMGAVYKWREAMTIGRRLQADLAQDQYHEVSYEQLTKRPEDELRRLCGFLGERFESGMLAFHADHDPASWRTWHQATTQPLTDAAVNRWQVDLDGPARDFVHHVLGEALLDRGYDVPGHGPADPVMLQAWAEHDARRSDALRRKQRRELRRTNECAFPVQAALTSTQRRLAADAGWLAEFSGRG